MELLNTLLFIMSKCAAAAKKRNFEKDGSHLKIYPNKMYINRFSRIKRYKVFKSTGRFEKKFRVQKGRQMYHLYRVT